MLFAACAEHKPPRYLMGVGTPSNIIEGVARGIDFFDCVMPTRNARHGHLFTHNGILNIMNAKYQTDDRPIEEGCQCPTCQRFSRAYLRHLLKSGEMLSQRLLVMHNLWFYNHLMQEIRDALDNGTFEDYRAEYSEKMSKRIRPGCKPERHCPAMMALSLFRRKGRTTMQKLSRRSLLLVGFTLFSMFFGAGNLIFPPYLGAQAGANAWLAFVGFAFSAIGLPVIGVIAVARAGGLSELAGRVHPRFAQVFALLVYLSIGPCLAIPRTASTSFQMLTPLVGGDAMRQLIYSIVFFAAAFFVALHPEKLTSWLGRILCPTLIVLIFVLFFGCLFHPVAEHYGVPTADYASLPSLTGILDGYQTMDTLAALNFGAVIALNIRDYGIEDEQQVRRSTIRAGWIAGAMLLLIYAMLTHVGALSGAAWPGGSTGADTLSNIASGLFGPVGQVLLAAIFVIACFNTCVGLIACVGQYFHELLPRIPYPAIAAFFAAASMIISNIGLAGIIRLSTPVLNAIYPVAIVLIALSFLPKPEKHCAVYRLCIAFTAVQSIAAAFPIPVVSPLLRTLPLSALGFGWLIPAAVGLLIGLLVPKKAEKA